MEEISKRRKRRAQGWVEERREKGDTPVQGVTKHFNWCDCVTLSYKPKTSPQFQKESLAF